MRIILSSLAAILMLSGCTTAKTERVYIGTQKAKGIYFADLDTKTGTLSTPKLAAETPNCGFVAIHPKKPYLYSTGLVAFRINEDGTLTEINSSSTEKGKGPCHVSVDHTGTCLMLAYYSGGAVASFKISPDGALSENISYHEHSGSGTDPKRQTRAHAHSIYPNPANTYAYAPDLGIDKVMIYKLDAEQGKLTPAGEAFIPGGARGPRHMKWDQAGAYAYVLNELNLTLSVFEAAENGGMNLLETISLKPEGFDKSDMKSAEIRIHPNGKFIYASNRDMTDQKRDSITVIKRYEDGFERIDTIHSEALFPRNFNIDPSGKWLLVGGKTTSDIAVFSIDSKTGLIEFTGQKVPFEGEPICLEFMN